MHKEMQQSSLQCAITGCRSLFDMTYGAEPDYSKRELDSKFENMIERQKEFENDMRQSHQLLQTSVEVGFAEMKGEVKELKEMVAFTNGKVKKIIIALVAVAAFSIGAGLVNIGNLLTLLKIGL